MTPLLRRPIALLLALAATGPTWALEWKETALTVRAEPFASSLDLVYDFRNTGSRPVTITDVQTSCHCLSADADKRVYQPGDAGRITAHFDVGDRYGTYERTISVASDDTTEPRQLTARIEVPDVAVVTPRALDWRVGGPGSEQSVAVRAADGLNINFTEATPTDQAFSVQLDVVEPGRVYRLRVTPVTTATTANAAIRIRGRDTTGHNVLVSAYANVH